MRMHLSLFASLLVILCDVKCVLLVIVHHAVMYELLLNLSLFYFF